MNTYLWLFRREFWENRAIWMLPAVISAVLLIIFMFGDIQIKDLPQHLSAEQLNAVAPMLLGGIGVGLFTIMSIYTSWYLLDCLYADRKDRSVLFWKSLPITDTDTVFSKLIMALIVIPLVYFIAADITALGASFILSVRGGSVFTAALWNPGNWLRHQVISLYLIITAAIWYLPFAAWLLLMSAWAKRAVTLWALLAPLVACYVEIKLLGTRFLIDALSSHMVGYVKVAFQDSSVFSHNTVIGEDTLRMPASVLELIDPAGFFASAQMWTGVAFGAIFIAGTIFLRQRHTEA